MLGALLLAAGCRDAGGGQDARTATPRAAAKAYAEAMTSGDAQAIGQVSTGDDGSLQVLTASATLNAAYARLEQAARKRFGDPKQVIAVGRASDHYANLLAGIDAAPEAVQDEQATVGSGPGKISLKKVGSVWKVDRAMHVPPGDGDSSRHVAMIRAMAQAYDEVTNGLASGTYDSAESAKAALLGKQMQAVLSQSPPPATRAAAGTRPAGTQPAGTRPVGTRPTGAPHPE